MNSPVSQLSPGRRLLINLEQVPDIATTSAIDRDVGYARQEVNHSWPLKPVEAQGGSTYLQVLQSVQSVREHAVRPLPPTPNSLPISSGKRPTVVVHATQATETMAPPRSPSTPHRSSGDSEGSSYETDSTSLPALQSRSIVEENNSLAPLTEDDYVPGSFDLVAPNEHFERVYSLETRSKQLFSKEHLKVIFSDPALLLRFTSFLNQHRRSSIPILVYYLDTIKALRAISYANAIAHSLEPVKGLDFTKAAPKPTINSALEEKAEQAFDALVKDDLPAYIAQMYIQTVSVSITRRIIGTLPVHLREASEGLAEVFCLTDPSRPDNPIVFASEEFHRTTQYGMNYVIGRNCRFLQGPETNPFSVRRIKDKINAGEEHCEVFLNYRRDGSPFMNLLMCAPLCDSRGKIRYFIGAQVDVSGLVKECSDLESLKRLIAADEQVETNSTNGDRHAGEQDVQYKKDQFQELSEMLNMQELDIVRRWGGWMHREQQEEVQDLTGNANWNKPRVLIHDHSPDGMKRYDRLGHVSGKLSGVYENYLLVRPYPSLRILFASPSLRVPGVLQSPFMAKIGGSSRVREELTQALADGRGVTAKVRWVTKLDGEGRNRWIHCTPLIGSNGSIGVWMIVVVDDETDQGIRVRFRQAPPVDPRFGRKAVSDDTSMSDFRITSNGNSIDNNSIRESVRDKAREPWLNDHDSDQGSLNTLRL